MDALHALVERGAYLCALMQLVVDMLFHLYILFVLSNNIYFLMILILYLLRLIVIAHFLLLVLSILLYNYLN